MERYETRIPYLISRYRCGTLTPGEQAELNAWRQSTPDNEIIFRQAAGAELRQHYQRYATIDPQAAWREIEGQIGQKHGRRRRRRLLWATTAAAVVVAGLIIGLNGSLFSQQPVIAIEQIGPGTKKAILTLADGRDVVIDESGSSLVMQDKAVVKLSSGEVSYENIDQTAVDVYNSITVPRGGEHKVTLSDGTQVWLNADSYIKYPMLFPGGERRVVLRGEAYFDVQPDPDRPFIVQTEMQSLEVLGTQFNLSAYADSPQVQTTLVEGSVCVRAEMSGDSVVLRPGEQSLLDDAGQSLRVATVNAYDFVSWRDGFINIQNNTLEEVLAKLSRWYDVDFAITGDDLGSIVFEGDIPKNSNLDSVVRMLEMAGGIEFVARHNVIEVKKR